MRRLKLKVGDDDDTELVILVTATNCSKFLTLRVKDFKEFTELGSHSYLVSAQLVKEQVR
jgi:hypothetical protein